MVFDKTLVPVDDVLTLETATSFNLIGQRAHYNVLRPARASCVRVRTVCAVSDGLM